MKFKQNASLTNLLSLKIADATANIFIPELVDDILLFTAKHNTFHVLSGGTNIVAGETEHPILYMGSPLGNSETRDVEDEEDFIVVQMPAGISNSAFLNYCIENGFSGLEFLAGIPGTIGGAVYGNAAPKGFSWDGRALALLVVVDGRITRIEPEFSYRQLVNKPLESFVIVAVELLLEKKTKEDVRMNMIAFLNNRIKIQRPSAGSFFKNPSEEFPAGLLLDQAGAKGYRVGGAGISETHANILLNYGSACAADFFELRDSLQAAVEKQHAIKLETEVVFLGSVG
ncbi:FAD-binding protein [bacterium]|nr:FAD-binding protein [bacterium]